MDVLKIRLPGGGVQHNFSAVTLATLALIGLCGTAEADENLYNGASINSNRVLTINSPLDDENVDNSNDKRTYYELTGGDSATLTAIVGNLGNFKPQIANSQFSIDVNGASLTVEGDVSINAVSDTIVTGWDQGTYLFYSHASNAVIDLQGNVNIVAKHDLSKDQQLDSIGNNIFYARDGGKIIIGREGTTTKAWSIAYQPDLISAKKGSSVIIQSTHNQLVGSMDMLDNEHTSPDTITATFVGSDSYWFGDDHTYFNAHKDIETTKLANNVQLMTSEWPDNKDKFELTFKDGAQWTYFGIPYHHDDYKLSTITKRISQITLEGGIINLFDENIQNTWKELGLVAQDGSAGAFPGLENIDHNYVRVGTLKGSNGIFRLDLNVDDKSKSDMVFIEGGEVAAGAKFYIEPYRPQDLTAITPDNRLRFATTAQGSGVEFYDKQNIEGKSLFDYQLIIESEAYNPSATEENAHYEQRVSDDGESISFDSNDLNWYITRVYVSGESDTSLAMTSAGFSVYDAVTQLDRYDSRNTEVSRYAGEKEGAWVRIRHGQNGSKDQYSADFTKASVGFDHYLTKSNRIGVGFTYIYSDTEFEDVDGSGELTGYEGMIYDTQYFNNQYLDFVFRFGDIKNEFDATNAVVDYSISADYHQKYAALSAEYGMRFSADTGAFIEPQVQLQLAYLADTDYEVQGGITSDIDSSFSAIGRIGVRAGNSWQLENGFTNDLYVRVDALYEFTDGQDATYKADNEVAEVTWGNKDTWYDVGVGGAFHFGNNFALGFDISKEIGGDVSDNWEVNGQARLIF